MKTMSKNLKAMIERKRLIRLDSPEAEELAEKILKAVEQSGGLTREEVYILSVN
jgi:hypothetical protein